MAHRLTFSGIAKTFGKQAALHPLTLSLEEGEILGFLGPNGAGKTTAIHLALGFLRPSAGSGMLLGKPFGDASARARLDSCRMCLSSFPRVDFAAWNSRRASMESKTDNWPRASATCWELSGSPTIARMRGNIRGGMQQRLALAQALISDPEVLILDEPAAALDPAGVLQVRELLRTARQAGKSIFFSSHQLTEVEHICDRIAFLNQGFLVRCGSLKELLSESDRVEIEVREPGKAELTRMIVPAKEQRRAIEGIWQAGNEIVSLSPMRRRLEDLFLEWSGE